MLYRVKPSYTEYILGIASLFRVVLGIVISLFRVVLGIVILFGLVQIIWSVDEFRAKVNADIMILSHLTMNLRKNLVPTCGHGVIWKEKITLTLRKSLTTYAYLVELKKKKFTIIVFRNNLSRNDLFIIPDVCGYLGTFQRLSPWLLIVITFIWKRLCNTKNEQFRKVNFTKRLFPPISFYSTQLYMWNANRWYHFLDRILLQQTDNNISALSTPLINLL